MSGLFGGGGDSGITAQTGLNISTALFGKPIPFVRGTVRVSSNCIYFGDLVAREVRSSAGKGGSVTTGFEYSVAVALAFCKGPVADVGMIWRSKDVADRKATFKDIINQVEFDDLEFFNGTDVQGEWGYLQSMHPEESLNYRGLAYGASGRFFLGPQASLPNLSIEVITPRVLGAPIKDESPADVLQDFLCENGFCTHLIDSDALEKFRAYCRREGLHISPVWSEQKALVDYVKQVLTLCNAAGLASRGLLRFIPYDDGEPVFAINQDELLSPAKKMNVNLDDQYNVIKLDCLNRDFEYNPDPVEVSDQAHIEAYGRREPEPVPARDFCDKSSARRAAQLMLQRSLYIRQQYEIEVGIQRSAYEPMDIGTIPYKGKNILVRIVSIDRQGDQFTWLCEEYVPGSGTTSALGAPVSGGSSANQNVPPGVMYPPLIMQPLLSFTGTPQVQVAVAGDSEFGGAEIWASTDDTGYQKIGITAGRAKYGKTITSLMAAGTTLDVQAYNANGEIEAYSAENAGRDFGLIYVDGEILSLQAEEMIGPNQYRYSGLLRGRKGTGATSHAIDSDWARLNQSIFIYRYAPSLAGATVFLKFLPFNKFGRNVTDITTVSPISIVLNPGQGDSGSENNTGPGYSPVGSGGDASAPPTSNSDVGSSYTAGSGAPDFIDLVAFEAIQTSAPLVGIRSDGQVGRASAGVGGLECVGFIVSNVAAGGTARVYFEGNVTTVFGLTPGVTYYLSSTVPGALTATPVDNTDPASVNKLHQVIGAATGLTRLSFEREPGIPIL